MPGHLHLLGRELELAQLAAEALELEVLLGPMVRRNVEAGGRRQPLEHRLAARRLSFEQRQHRGQQVLGRAQREDVDERRHRQRVDHRARAAHDHQRMGRVALLAPQRNAGAPQHGEEVHVVLLERDRERDAAEGRRAGSRSRPTPAFRCHRRRTARRSSPAGGAPAPTPAGSRGSTSRRGRSWRRRAPW